MKHIELKGPNKRQKFQIYLAILSTIQEECTAQEGAKPTRIQRRTRMSYNKLICYLDELEKMKTIIKAQEISLTERGREILKEYDRIRHIVE